MMFTFAKDNVIYDNGHCFVLRSDNNNCLQVFRYSRGFLEYISIFDIDEQEEAMNDADYFDA